MHFTTIIRLNFKQKQQYKSILSNYPMQFIALTLACLTQFFNTHCLIEERACKSHLHKLSILQNKIIRVCVFCSRRDSMALQYSKVGVLKLKNMINIKTAKSMFKFHNGMLPSTGVTLHNFGTSVSHTSYLVMIKVWQFLHYGATCKGYLYTLH